MTRLTQAVAQQVAEVGGLKKATAAKALALNQNVLQDVFSQVAEALGGEHKTFAGEVLKAVKAERVRLWRSKVHDDINWQIFDRGVEASEPFVPLRLGRGGSAAARRLRRGRNAGEGAQEENDRARDGRCDPSSRR